MVPGLQTGRAEVEPGLEVGRAQAAGAFIAGDGLAPLAEGLQHRPQIAVRLRILRAQRDDPAGQRQRFVIIASMPGDGGGEAECCRILRLQSQDPAAQGPGLPKATSVAQRRSLAQLGL